MHASALGENRALVHRVQKALSPDLLHRSFRRLAGSHPHAGHCYAASEALYHALGGPRSGYRPHFVRHEGEPHWFLKDRSGVVLDPTAGQFKAAVPYESGIAKGFLTREPSKRARTILTKAGLAVPESARDRVVETMRRDGTAVMRVEQLLISGLKPQEIIEALVEDRAEHPWHKPGWDDEIGEFERVSKEHGIPLGKLKKQFEQSRVNPLSPEVLKRMKNTDAAGEKMTVPEVHAMAKRYGGKNSQGVLQGFRSGKSMAAPIVLHLKGEAHLVSGNTRLVMGKALGKKLQAVHVDMN